MYKLASYQEAAVEKVVYAFKELLSAIPARETRGDVAPARIILKAPTGSGKTIMAAEVLRALNDQDMTEKFVYIWAAPNRLHTQSLNKLKDILRDTNYNLVDVESLESGALAENTVLFTNWEKLYSRNRDGEWSNRAVRRTESEQNLQDVIDATRLLGYKMILIVDESHQTFFGTNSQLLTNEVIRPNIIFEISATPKIAISEDDRDEDRGRRINVRFEDVVESGLIKRNVQVNPQIESFSNEGTSGIEVILAASLAKREELLASYKETGADINPLVLIQLPSENTENLTDLDIRDKDLVESYLLNHGISYSNGELAIWLSEDKKNLEDIEKPNAKVKVLIFKQAIALGWDCPRAQVLVMLRDVKSEVFRVQTVGRILRMPEARHYENDTLNSAYVFTDLSDLKVDPNDADAKNLIKLFSTKRRTDITNIVLPKSVYLHRADYGDLRADFNPVLLDILNQTFEISGTEMVNEFYKKIDEKLEIYDEELVMPIVADEIIENLDIFDREAINTIDLKMDDISVERSFNTVLRALFVPFKNFARSKAIVSGTIYQWFARGGLNESDVQRIVACSERNQKIFSEIFEAAKSVYEDLNQQEITERRRREIEIFDFEIPATDEFSENYTWVPTEKNVMERYFRQDDGWKTELRFETAIDKSNDVNWWYKQGIKMRKYFAVPYSMPDKNGKERRDAFYPDYIIRYNDGTIGIYDTKNGRTLDGDTKPKAEALQKYIAENSSNKQKIIGGIIDARQDGTFWLNSEDIYSSEVSNYWSPFLK